MVTKVYIASRLSDAKRVRSIIEKLKLNNDIEISHDWTDTEEFDQDCNVFYNQQHEFYTDDIKNKYATLDINGVKNADILIFLADLEGYLGALIEVGAAIALNKKVFVVSTDRDSVFYYLENVTKVDSIDQVIKELS